MPLARPEPCPAHRTLTEVVAASGSAETLLAMQAHAAECAECKRIAPRLLVVARGVEAAASQSGDRSIDAGARDWSFAPLAQRYELGREIARGGMGRIHEAWDRTHERRVAIKLLLRPGTESVRRFAREASITARLQHPAIVAVYDTGALPSGEPFYRAAIAFDTDLERTSTSRGIRIARARTLRRLGELLAKDPARRAEARAALIDATAILARFAAEGRLAPVERAELDEMSAELRALPSP